MTKPWLKTGKNRHASCCEAIVTILAISPEQGTNLYEETDIDRVLGCKEAALAREARETEARGPDNAHLSIRVIKRSGLLRALPPGRSPRSNHQAQSGACVYTAPVGYNAERAMGAMKGWRGRRGLSLAANSSSSAQKARTTSVRESDRGTGQP